MRGVDDFWIDVSDDEVDLVGQPADAEHHHHNHHHLDDLLGKVKVKVKHDFTAPLLSRIERRGEERRWPLRRSALYSEEVRHTGIKTEIQPARFSLYLLYITV